MLTNSVYFLKRQKHISFGPLIVIVFSNACLIDTEHCEVLSFGRIIYLKLVTVAFAFRIFNSPFPVRF
jgi:hypothetical protein